MSVLPDVLAPSLKVVSCGTAVGTRSARARAYYHKPNNQFWKVLFRTSLTPRLLAPHEFHLLLEYGIGLTDLAKTRFGSDSSLTASDFGAEPCTGPGNRLSGKYGTSATGIGRSYTL